MDVIAAAGRAGTADEAIVRLAAAGDLGAFDALMSRRLDRCYRIAWSILGSDADAADATQDALVRAWRELPRLREPAAFEAWLNRIVSTTALMALRRRKRLREVPVAPAEQASQSAGGGYATGRPNEIDAVPEADAMRRALARLAPADRSILALHHLDERPVAEIAATLQVPVGTAKWRLHRARRALERAMEAEE